MVALSALSAGCSAVGSPGYVDASADVDPAADRSAPSDAPTSPDAPGVPCPGSIAGNGAPCDLVGDGCGGDVACGVSYACSCNAVHRWQCITMPSVCDASVDAPTTTCSLVGTYFLRVDFVPYYLSLRADGQWRLSLTIDGLTTSTAGGTYAVSGAQVSFRQSTTSITHCSTSDVGTYAFSFSPDCGLLRLGFITEPCTARSAAFAGPPLERQ